MEEESHFSHFDDAGALRIVETAMALIFRPPPKLLPSEWAEQKRVLSRESSARGGGKWRNFPMQVEPMDETVNPEVGSVCLMWAAQTAGKTELILNITGFFMEMDPCPIQMVQPTLDLADDYSTDRVDTMIRDTPSLEHLFTNFGKTTVRKKSFPGGFLIMAGANSPTSLSSRPIRVTLFDEIDRFPKSAKKEGDPIGLAEMRQETFPNAVSIKTSTPTIRKHSRVESEFDLSDKRYWMAICPHCQLAQRLVWKNVRWDDEKRLDLTYYLCENKDCSNPRWTDQDRIAAIKAGHWKATAPFNGVRGYHLSGIYSLFRHKTRFKSRLHQMAYDFLKAKRLGKERLKVWVNTFLAETWSDESDIKPDWAKLFSRASTPPEGYKPYDSFGTIPIGVQLVNFGTDIQADRIEIEFVGHGPGEETWGLGNEVIWGDTRVPDMYKRLDEKLNRTFKREDGVILHVDGGGIDTGYAAAQRQIYQYLRPRLQKRYFGFKGSSVKTAEPISTAKKTKVDRIRLFMVGTHAIKSYIYGRATLENPGPGYMHFACDYPAEWFKQLLVEDFEIEIIGGEKYQIFSMPSVVAEGSTDRNEALDKRVYAIAALYARGLPNWDKLEARNLATIAEPEQPPPLPTSIDIGPRIRPSLVRRKQSLLKGLFAGER